MQPRTQTQQRFLGRSPRLGLAGITALALLAFGSVAHAVDLGSESFENPAGSAEDYLGNPYLGSFFVDDNDYFALRDISADTTPLGWDDVSGNPSAPITGLDGNWAIVSEDVNDGGNPLATFSVIRTGNFSVTGFSNLQVTVRLGSHVAWNSSWETNDSVRIEYDFDNPDPIAGPANTLSSAGYTVAGAFYGNGTSHGVNDGSFSDGPARDDNLNGQFDTGETTLIPSNGSMQDFTFSIPGTGTNLSIQVVVDDTGGSEELAVDFIRVTGDPAATDPPVLAGIEPAPASYAEGAPPTQVTNTLTITDTDSNIEGATVQITGNNQPGEDVLSVGGALPAGITAASYVPATGLLSLSGSATPAAYQIALRQVEYSNSSTNPNVFVTRTITIQANDGTDPSNTQTRDLDVTGSIADQTIPYLEDFDTDGDGVRYTSNSFTNAATASPPSDYFERTDVNPHPGHNGPYTFTSPQGGGYFAAEDVNDGDNPLGTDQPGIVRLPTLDATGLGNLQVAVYLADNRDGTTFGGGESIEVQAAFDGNVGGTNLLGGSYAVVGRFIANAAGALQQDTNLDGSSDDPADDSSPTLTSTLTPYTFDIPGTGSMLSVQVVVTDISGNEEIAFDHITVNGSSVGFPPVLANIEGAPLGYTEGDSATQITNTITVSDSDDTALEGATVQITTGYQNGEDVLAVSGLPGGITEVAFNPLDGSIGLTGTASLADYQTALRQIAYQNTNLTNPNFCDRTVVFQVTDGSSNSNFQSRDINVIGVVPPGTIPYLEDFDIDGDGVRYTSNSFTDGQVTPQDYFERTDLNPHPGQVLNGPFTFTAPQGAGYWASEDILNSFNKFGNMGIVRLPDLNATGFADLQVSLYLGELAGTLEATDMIEVQYAFDGDRGGTDLTAGTYTTIGRFVASGSSLPLRLDSDLDGVSNDPEDAASPDLTSTMTQYTFAIPATGALLSVQVKITQDGGTEEIGFDHIEVFSPNTAPVITLVGPSPQFVECGDAYVELGATAADAEEGDITGSIVIDASAVDTSTPGDYLVTYNVTDSGGGAATEVTRTVTVQDTTPPSLTLNDLDPLILECPTPYVEPGANTTDVCDPSPSLVITGSVDSSTPGAYIVTYTSTDATGNSATDTRTVNVVDTTPPVITLVGANPLVLECPSPYIELGAAAVDTCDLSLGPIVIDATAVNISTPGSYPVTYNISDASGNPAVQVIRTVNVVDTMPPVITLVGVNPLVLECPNPYTELGATAADTCDLGLSAIVIDASAVDTSTAGSYPVTYNISDASGNAAMEVVRTVDVVDTTPPVITLVGSDPQVIECPDPYIELGATATDCDASLGPIVIDASAVDTSTPGSYPVTYNVSDTAGNPAAQVTRTVDVVDTTPPVITLVGSDPQVIECLDSYIELGATAADICDGDISGSIVIDASAVDISTPGSYPVTYNVSDASGNPAAQVTRTVDVVDTTPPVITLDGADPQTVECGDPYIELGATATDCDASLGPIVIDASAVDTSTPGSYPVTYNISDSGGNPAVQVVRTVNVVDTTPPVITLVGADPQTVECGDPYIELGATAADICDGDISGWIVIDASTVDTSTPGFYVVTYNVSDATGNPATTVTRTVTVQDTIAPVMTCPPDVILTCEDCDTDPLNSGEPTDVFDACAVAVTFTDNVSGVCPQVTERTWRAEDDSGNFVECVQIITCLPPEAVTDSSLCIFDRDPEKEGQQFRVLFTPDGNNWPNYKISSTNPGQLFYNVFHLGTPGDTATLTLQIPYPLVTQGANPIHAYDWSTVVENEDGEQCFVPAGEAFFVDSTQLTLADYGAGAGCGDTTPLTLSLTVPDTGFLYLTVHLTYGLKGTGNYAKEANDDAVDPDDPANVLVPNCCPHVFAVSGSENDSTTVENTNAFKRNPGAAGMALNPTGDPVIGASVLLSPTGGAVVGTDLTDEDGHFGIVYKHRGRPTDYDVALDTGTYSETQQVRLRGNGFAFVEFAVPDFPGGGGAGLQLRLGLEAALPQFSRGDSNDDGRVDLADATFTLNWLFFDGPAPGCVAVANTNGDEGIDLADPVALLNHLFLGGPAPVEPFLECGPGTPADEALGCQETPLNCGTGL